MSIFQITLLANLTLFVPAFTYLLILGYEHEYLIELKNEQLTVSKKYIHPKIRSFLKFTVLCLPIAILLTIPVGLVYFVTSIIVDTKKLFKSSKNKTNTTNKSKTDYLSQDQYNNNFKSKKSFDNLQKKSINTLDIVEYLVFNPKRTNDVN